jgi:hypothetical protein
VLADMGTPLMAADRPHITECEVDCWTCYGWRPLIHYGVALYCGNCGTILMDGANVRTALRQTGIPKAP